MQNNAKTSDTFQVSIDIKKVEKAKLSKNILNFVAFLFKGYKIT